MKLAYSSPMCRSNHPEYLFAFDLYINAWSKRETLKRCSFYQHWDMKDCRESVDTFRKKIFFRCSYNQNVEIMSFTDSIKDDLQRRQTQVSYLSSKILSVKHVHAFISDLTKHIKIMRVFILSVFGGKHWLWMVLYFTGDYIYWNWVTFTQF